MLLTLFKSNLTRKKITRQKSPKISYLNLSLHCKISHSFCFNIYLFIFICYFICLDLLENG